LWLITLLLLVVAIVGKFAGATLASRYAGLTGRESIAVGTLMNTRGLTELIVLNIGLDLGVISPQLFTMLVVMALITTFMAGPVLRVIAPKRKFCEPVENELRRERTASVAVPTTLRSIMVAPQDPRNLDALMFLAEPLAQAIPPRELVLVQAF